MSSYYSSRRTSVNPRGHLKPSDDSSLQTSCPQPPLSWFEMSSKGSRDELESAADDSFDIETLIYKLQMHQLDVQEHELEALMKRREQTTESDTMQTVSNTHSRMQSDGDSPTLPALSDPNSIVPTPMPEQATPIPERNSVVQNFSMKNRASRPPPLKLVEGHVSPQEVQSASLPPRSSSRTTVRDHTAQHSSLKKHRRRMTISAASGQSSIPMLVLSPGHYAEIDVPPMPELTFSPSLAASPPSRSPATPTEDQIRRELEAMAMDGGVEALQRPRTSSSSQKRRGVFIPDDEDRVTAESHIAESKPVLKPNFPEPVAADPPKRTKSTLSRKKSIFGRFEKKNEVDQLLDLYFTDEQLEEEENNRPKRKSSMAKMHALFRQRKTDDVPVPQISITS